MKTKIDTQKAPKAFRTISEVADVLDLQPYVIRFWESQFKQIKPMRGKGGRRYYRPRDVDFLRGLKALLHGENFTIKKVRETIVKRGKEFIVEWSNDKPIQTQTIEKQKLQIKFRHTGQKTLHIRTKINEEEKINLNLLIKSFNKLKQQILARNGN